MKIVILVPYRADQAERTRNWDYLKNVWEETGWPIFEGESPPGKFCRAHALNDAARRAGEWDVAVIADADQMVGNTWQAQEAAELAWETGSYIAAHDIQRYLTKQGTEEVLSGKREMARAQQSNPVGLTWEGVTACSRGLWEEVGGMDERFIGYGAQGIAFFFAATCFAGSNRVSGAVYHFHHQEARDNSDPQLAANLNLAERYRQAIDDPMAMRAILAER